MDYDPTELIKCFVLYRNTSFEKLKVSEHGFGKVAETSNFDIKVYNKSLQYNLPQHLLRFEVKVKKMVFLKRYGIENLTFSDLAKQEIYPLFKKMLLDIFDKILLYNPDITSDKFTNNQDRELFLFAINPDNWQNLDHRRKSEKLKRFEQLAGSGEIKEIFKTKISDKWEMLTRPDKITTYLDISKPDKITTFYSLQERLQINDTGQNHLTINGYNVLLCKVTGLRIHDQQPSTTNLTEKGIKWYYENEPEIYKQKLESLLTKRWFSRHRSEEMEAYFEEIYHQIRSRLSTPRSNLKLGLKRLENKGPKLFPTVELLSPEKLRIIGGDMAFNQI